MPEDDAKRDAELKEIYAHLLAVTHTQGTWNWVRWHMFLLVNGALMAAVGAAINAMPDSWTSAAFGVASAGIVMSVVWFHSAEHGSFFYRMREMQAREIEEEIGGVWRAHGIFSRGAELRDEAKNGSAPLLSFEESSGPCSLPLPLWRGLNMTARRASEFTHRWVPGTFGVLWLLILCVSLWLSPSLIILAIALALLVWCLASPIIKSMQCGTSD